MNKSELITAIAEHANFTKADAGRALDGLTKTIETTLKTGDSITLGVDHKLFINFIISGSIFALIGAIFLEKIIELESNSLC